MSRITILGVFLGGGLLASVGILTLFKAKPESYECYGDELSIRVDTAKDGNLAKISVHKDGKLVKSFLAECSDRYGGVACDISPVISNMALTFMATGMGNDGDLNVFKLSKEIEQDTLYLVKKEGSKAVVGLDMKEFFYDVISSMRSVSMSKAEYLEALKTDRSLQRGIEQVCLREMEGRLNGYFCEFKELKCMEVE